MTNRTISGLSRGGELMDLVQERANVVEEDRISNLPHDIIHHILSFLDMKYAVQTCALSKKWKHIWTSMPHLKFNSRLFPYLLQFAKFVKHTLSGRNNHTEVSAVDLTFTGSATQFVIKSIVNYAYLHNVRKLNLTLFTHKVSEFPQHFLSSHTLKHLSIEVGHPFRVDCLVQNLDWDFPVLETLNMKKLLLGTVNDNKLNLFSTCVNLKELTLNDCSAYGSGIINICAPQLSSLTITGNNNFHKDFNVVSSHLENLTLSITYKSWLNLLEKSPEGLNKVNLSSSGATVLALLDLFPKLHCAKYLILDWKIIEILLLCLDEFSCEPCPFDNLECLKIDTSHLTQNQTTAIATQVKNYFLGNSRNAIFIMDQPQVPQKRSKVNNDAEKSQPAEVISEQQVPQKRSLESVHNEATTANKVAKLDEMVAKVIADQKAQFEAKIQMQDEVIADQKSKLQMQDEVIAMQKAMLEAKIQMQDKLIAEQKALFEANIQMQDGVVAEQKGKLKMLNVTLQNQKLMSEIIKCKIAELKVQVESGNPDYEAIRLIGRDIKSTMELVPEISRTVMESQFSFEYVELKSQLLNHIDASKWAHIDSELGNIVRD